jgi:uncharacterized membrane protein YgcG
VRLLRCAVVAGTAVDFGLYQTFWRMQAYMLAPAKAVESADAWASFLSGVGMVVSALEGQGGSSAPSTTDAPVAADEVEEGEEGEEQTDGGSSDVKRGTATSGGGFGGGGASNSGGASSGAGALSASEEFYCTKYLTNSSLFNLEARECGSL